MKLVTIYRALGDETRVRILNLLQAGELCVCHIQDILGLPQVKVSKHLAFLRRHGLVKSRRCRQWVIYSLADRMPQGSGAALQCLWDSADTEAVLRRDRRRQQKLADRLPNMPGMACLAACNGDSPAEHSSRK